MREGRAYLKFVQGELAVWSWTGREISHIVGRIKNKIFDQLFIHNLNINKPYL